MLAVVAVAEPFLLSAAARGLVAFAAVVLAVQLVAAGSVLAMGLDRAAAPADVGA